VIIVDYRGFDTLGEITVLAIAALTHARAAGRMGAAIAPGATALARRTR
jgi:multisubunit Na+/H+ antiporter MnhB subunit